MAVVVARREERAVRYFAMVGYLILSVVFKGIVSALNKERMKRVYRLGLCLCWNGSVSCLHHSIVGPFLQFGCVVCVVPKSLQITSTYLLDTHFGLSNFDFGGNFSSVGSFKLGDSHSLSLAFEKPAFLLRFADGAAALHI